MSRIVCKFGGSSVADAAQFRKVQAIVEADPRRSVIVPSAPGKRTSSETKLTDLLYLCQEMAEMKTDFKEPFDKIRDRYLEIARDLALDKSLIRQFEEELEAFRTELKDGRRSRDYVASRGEHFNGRLMAAFLKAEYIEPADYLTITSMGTVTDESYGRLGAAMSDLRKRYVMPGFYGRDSHGQIKTFSRGGSDISGAIAAAAAKAELYENWTDVSGLLMADPRVVKNPKAIAEISYREIRELSYMGASVFHDEAILPVRRAGIPINIRNTNAPAEPGTLIVPVLSQSTMESTEVAGVAGKRDFSMICLEKSLMNKETGFAYRLLGIFEKNGISVEHCPTGIDTISVIVENLQLADKGEVVDEEIRRILQPDRLEWERDLALVAVVGEEMIHAVGVAAKVFRALAEAKINVRVINQGASELSIIVGVASSDLERAVQALYSAFVE